MPSELAEPVQARIREDYVSRGWEEPAFHVATPSGPATREA
ncbi:hypothetical protein [Janibacter melonis]|nr:hypothetical protein [Janibacter melonis]